MKAYIDGSSNGVYGYLLNSKEKIVQDYPMTNNQAEWLALLILLMDLEPKTKINIYSDSQIVVNQFEEEWETRNPVLKHLKELCLLIVQTKKLKVTIHWVPRKKNPFGIILEKRLNRERKRRKKLREKINRGYR